MDRWRKSLFTAMARNAGNVTEKSIRVFASR